MKKAVRQTIRFTVVFAIGILLLYLAFRGIDFSEMIEHFRGAKYSWIGLSLIFALFSHISRARRWNLLIEPLNYKPKLWNTFNAVMFGYLANYALPRIGEVTRCVSLGRKEKIPVDSLIGTVIVERAIDFLCMLLILLFLLVARFDKFGNFFGEYIFLPISEKMSVIFGDALFFWLILAGVGVIALLVVIVFWQKISRIKLVGKVIDILKGILTGLKTVRKMERKWEFLFHTIFIWTNYALMTWVIVFSLPEITGDLKFVDGIFLLVIGSMGMAVPVQSGIGAFHWIVSRGLHYVYNLDLTEGLVFATLQHESQTLMILLVGSLSMLFILSKKKNRGDDSQIPDHDR